MDVLPLHFTTLRLCGVWYEPTQHWLVKYLWQPFTVNSIFLFSLSQLGALSVYRDNVNDFTECLFLSLTYFGLCFKLVNLLCRHDAMIRLLSEFRADVCRPRDRSEVDLLRRYKRIAAIVFNVHIGAAQLNGLSFAIVPIFAMMAGNVTILPYKTYEIYDRDNSMYYWTTYVFQVVTACISTFVNVTLDTILAGFLLTTCGQIDLCCHRFVSASSATSIERSTRECIAHHTLIWRIVRKLEAFFMRVVLPLMFLSLVTFCTSVYNMSQSNNSGAEWASFFIYFVCLLCQLLCYCWFGNELKLKSTAICDSIYNSDWTTLRPVDRKNLYFVMLSCQREMSISFHGFCTLSIEIFVWVLKTSYGAYNLLTTVE